ncbi:MAG: hypothetical protein ACTHU0_30505 [Kofleriaceae bacterium]
MQELRMDCRDRDVDLGQGGRLERPDTGGLDEQRAGLEQDPGERPRAPSIAIDGAPEGREIGCAGIAEAPEIRRS